MNIENYIFRAALTLTLVMLVNSSLWAQTPEKMSYQAVVRDSDDVLITNTQVGMQISILQGSINGTAIYTETQTPTANDNGLVSIEIGGGTGFGDIDWATNVYFIKSETDPTGGTNYSITGTSQLLSVPYALHAKTADSITGLSEIDPRVPYGNRPGDMQYWNGTEWTIVSAGTEGDILTFVNNKPTWAGDSSFGTILNPTTGETWMDKNLGASQVATSSTDADSYGDFYQWGRGTDGHEKRISGTTATLSTTDTPGHGNFITSGVAPKDWRSPQNNNLWQGEAGINNPCPSGYRLPTYAEWDAERQSWSSNDAPGAFASLKLPLAGVRYAANGDLGSVDTIGHYWSSTIVGADSRYLGVFGGGANTYFDPRANGMSVRCIKE